MENKNSPAKIKAIRKYDTKTYDKLSFRVKKGQKEILTEYATAQGLSLSGLINKLLSDNVPDFNK